MSEKKGTPLGAILSKNYPILFFLPAADIVFYGINRLFALLVSADGLPIVMLLSAAVLLVALPVVVYRSGEKRGYAENDIFKLLLLLPIGGLVWTALTLGLSKLLATNKAVADIFTFLCMSSYVSVILLAVFIVLAIFITLLRDRKRTKKHK